MNALFHLRRRTNFALIMLLLVSALAITTSLQNPSSTLLPTAQAHNPNPAYTTISAYGTPTIDGVMSPGEWTSCNGPTITSGNGNYPEGTATYTVTNEPNVSITFCGQNDGANDYYAFGISGIPSSPADQMYLLFDDNHDGAVSSSCSPNSPNMNNGVEDALGFLQTSIPTWNFFDMNYCGVPPSPQPNFSFITLDTQHAGGSQNGVGVAKYDPISSSYVFEMSHPMNSGDGYDYALAPGSVFGWCVAFYDANSHHVIDYPIDCYHYYANAGTPPPTNARYYGDIKKLPAPSGTVCDMAINKTMAPNPVVSGQPATITLAVWNNGSVTCGNLGTPTTTAVTENLPAGLTATGPPTVSPVDGWSCAAPPPPPLVGPGTITCTTNTPIPPTTQASPFATITIPVTVTAASGSMIHNCAHVANPLDQNPANNDSCVDIPVIGASGCDLSITKTMSVSSNGSAVVITLTVTNVGGAACLVDAAIKVTDNVTSPLTATSAGGPGWSCTLQVICTSGVSIPPSGTSMITIIANVTGGPGTVQNCAQLTFPGDTNPNNNVSCASANVVPEFPGSSAIIMAAIAAALGLSLTRRRIVRHGAPLNLCG